MNNRNNLRKVSYAFLILFLFFSFLAPGVSAKTLIEENKSCHAKCMTNRAPKGKTINTCDINCEEKYPVMKGINEPLM